VIRENTYIRYHSNLSLNQPVLSNEGKVIVLQETTVPQLAFELMHCRYSADFKTDMKINPGN